MKDQLKSYMEKNNLTQKQFANLLGVSESHLSRVLNNKKEAGAKIAKAYFELPGVRKIEELKELKKEIKQIKNQVYRLEKSQRKN